MQQLRLSFWSRVASCGLAAAVVLVCGSVRADADGGWSTLTIESTGTYARLFVPPALDPGEPSPVVVMLHGSGAWPEHYERFVEGPADALGCIVLLPRSQLSAGWGDPLDPLTISSGLELVRAEALVDEARIGLAGHSSGGAYAFLLAYTTIDHWSAVFSLGAPFITIERLANGRYTAPLRMYYGADDPNLTGGSRSALMVQWQALGVPVEEDIQPGYGHSTWPDSSILAGLAFVTGRSYPLQPGEGPGPCRGTETRLCLRDGRFQVELAWEDTIGRTGPGRVASAGTGDSGLLWFFSADNWEVLVKVLDGCALNDHYWVFAAATTDVGYTLEVVDLVSEARFTHVSPAGVAAVALNATRALDACP